VSHHFNRAKDFLGKAYNQTKSFLGDVDSGVKTFKNIYGVVAPILDSYGLNASKNTHVIKALSGYDDIRNNIIEKHDRVVNDVKKVKNNLVKKNINLDFS
jgi:hypothetical protein